LHSRRAPEAHKSCVDSSTQEVSSYGPSTDGDLQASQQVPLVALQNVENTQLNTCAEGTLQNKSTSLDHMLAPGIPSPITRPLYPPSLNMDVTRPTSPLPSFDVSQRCSPRIGSLLHPVLSTPLKHNMLDDSGPCFRLMEELDDYGNYIEDPYKRKDRLAYHVVEKHFTMIPDVLALATCLQTSVNKTTHLLTSKHLNYLQDRTMIT